jgi:hypothetical protein
MQAYASGALGKQEIPFSSTDRIIAIGSDRMMAAVALPLKPTHRAIGSINSPMQCMMKEIRAHCVQPHVDPQTGQTSYVFSCFNQDQPLDQVDYGALSQRLAQNGVQEKLTAPVDRPLPKTAPSSRARLVECLQRHYPETPSELTGRRLLFCHDALLGGWTAPLALKSCRRRRTSPV